VNEHTVFSFIVADILGFYEGPEVAVPGSIDHIILIDVAWLSVVSSWQEAIEKKYPVFIYI